MVKKLPQVTSLKVKTHIVNYKLLINNVTNVDKSCYKNQNFRILKILIKSHVTKRFPKVSFPATWLTHSTTHVVFFHFPGTVDIQAKRHQLSCNSLTLVAPVNRLVLFQILALLLEGRRKNTGGRSSRRSSSAQYRYSPLM